MYFISRLWSMFTCVIRWVASIGNLHASSISCSISLVVRLVFIFVVSNIGLVLGFLGVGGCMGCCLCSSMRFCVCICVCWGIVGLCLSLFVVCVVGGCIFSCLWVALVCHF